MNMNEVPEEPMHEDSNPAPVQGQDQPHSWLFEEEERLVALVAKVPAFYNRRAPGHQNKALRLKNWDLIGKQMNIPGDEVCRRFTHLREHYARYVRARREGFKGKLFWYKKFRLSKQMSFLSKHIYSRQKRSERDFEDAIVEDEIDDNAEDEFEGEVGDNDITESSKDLTSFEDLISFPGRLFQDAEQNRSRDISPQIGLEGSAESQGRPTGDMHKRKNIDTCDTPDYRIKIIASSPSRLPICALTNPVPIELRSSTPSKSPLDLEPDGSRTKALSNDKLLHILERGGPNLESGPNYLFGMYVASKLDKMSPEDASYCTLRIHEVLYRAEIRRHRKSQILNINVKK